MVTGSTVAPTMLTFTVALLVNKVLPLVWSVMVT